MIIFIGIIMRRLIELLLYHGMVLLSVLFFIIAILVLISGGTRK